MVVNAFLVVSYLLNCYKYFEIVSEIQTGVRSARTGEGPISNRGRVEGRCAPSSAEVVEGEGRERKGARPPLTFALPKASGVI